MAQPTILHNDPAYREEAPEMMAYSISGARTQQLYACIGWQFRRTSSMTNVHMGAPVEFIYTSQIDQVVGCRCHPDRHCCCRPPPPATAAAAAVPIID
jgi:hypothetical protein